jgi:HNH endonuclease
LEELERFWTKVNKTSTCWIWTASKRNKGYGAFYYKRNGKAIHGRAHRYAYELYKGPIPNGLSVLHNCPDGDNPACVNPDHLWLGTIAQNNADIIKKGRHVKGGTYRAGQYPRGSQHPGAKLNWIKVREIRTRKQAGASFSVLAREYGLSIGYVFRLIKGVTWKE